jgi:hypothetical protein
MDARAEHNWLQAKNISEANTDNELFDKTLVLGNAHAHFYYNKDIIFFSINPNH